MTLAKGIQKGIGSVEKELSRRVSSLEKDVTLLTKKLAKKENEVIKLKDKFTSGLVKDVKKTVKKAKNAVRGHLPGIG